METGKSAEALQNAQGSIYGDPVSTIDGEHSVGVDLDEFFLRVGFFLNNIEVANFDDDGMGFLESFLEDNLLSFGYLGIMSLNLFVRENIYEDVGLKRVRFPVF